MRLLLLSDTHGRLGIINELATNVRADAVIHAGDFGFFDHGSFERLSDHELKPHVAHSGLMQTENNQVLALSRNDLIETVREHRLLDGFQSCLDGVKSFQVPVHAVWEGNHEDLVSESPCKDRMDKAKGGSNEAKKVQQGIQGESCVRGDQGTANSQRACSGVWSACEPDQYMEKVADGIRARNICREKRP